MGHPQIRFLVADGSIGDDNYRLFSSKSLPNLEYRRFPPDETLHQYISKMKAAGDSTSTDYAMTMDAGDYLNHSAVLEAVSLLDAKVEASVCAGDSVRSYELLGRVTYPCRVVSLQHLADKGVEDFLDAIKVSYSYLWYGVFRARTFQRAWSFMEKHSFRHPMLEYAPTMVGIADGTIAYSPSPLILRIVDAPYIRTRQPPDFNATDGDSLSSELKQFASACEDELGAPWSAVIEAFECNAKTVLQELTHQLPPRSELSKSRLKYRIVMWLENLPYVGSNLNYLIGLQSSMRRSIYRLGSQSLIPAPHMLHKLNRNLVRKPGS